MYYVYLYLNTKEKVDIQIDDITLNYRPIYVGKGKGRRMYLHLTECLNENTKNYLFYNKLSKMLSDGNDPKIIKVKSFKREVDALNYEIKLIKEFGKIKDGGYLFNLTDGGDGISGYKHTEETKKVLSELKIGNVLSDEHKEKISNSLKGIKKTKKHSENISKGLTGKKLSKEHRQKLSEARMGKKPWNYGKMEHTILQYDMDGNFIKEWFSLIDLEKSGFQKPNVINVCKGKRKSHKGFLWDFSN